MQSTEEYLDQLLASVSGEEAEEPKEQSKKSIEDLDETELTEEALQEQLAMLLGLEIERDEPDETEDFMSQYAAQMIEESESDTETEIYEAFAEASETIVSEAESAEAAVTVASEVMQEEVAPAPQISNTGVLSADEIAALFASMSGEESALEPAGETASVEELPSETMVEEVVEEPIVEVMQEPVPEVAPTPQVSETGVLSPDEIAALFASMGADESVDGSADKMPESTEAESVAESANKETVSESIKETMPAVSDMSDNRMMSPDEIAALFASMSGEDPVVDATSADSIADEETVENIMDDNADFGMSSIDELMDLKGSEDDIQEIPDLNLDEETLLDLENVDALLEATAKQAEDSNSGEDLLAMEEKMEEDIFSMLAQFEEESVQESMAQTMQAEDFGDIMSFDDEDGIPAELLEEDNDGEAKDKKKKKEKVKKEKVKKEKVKKEKTEKKNKVSLKDKIMAFAFEDEEDNAEGGGDERAEGSADKKTAKDKKKEKASKKNKKADKGKPKDENEAIEAELAEEDKKKKQQKKKEKPVKEKKVKPPKKEKTPEQLEAERKEERRSIKTGGIVATLLVCASILGLILVGTYFVPKQLSLMSARVAFYAGDYEEVTMRLEGRNLNDSDRLMYEKSNLLYGLQERYHQHEIYVKRQMPKEALNALLQGIAACKEEAILAEQLGIVTEWKVIKEQFENALMQQYGLDAQTSDVISELRNPAYTIAVENIMAGKAYDDMSAYGGSTAEDTVKEPAEESDKTSEETQTPALEDLLPEEEAILEQMQQDNNALPEQEASSEPESSSEEGDRELYSGTVNSGSVNFAE